MNRAYALWQGLTGVASDGKSLERRRRFSRFLDYEGTGHGFHSIARHNGRPPTTVTTPDRYSPDHRIRLTLASTLGGGLDGAWWPYSAAMARELPSLVEALSGRLGEVVDIAVNWSSLEGTPDLNALPARGVLPGQKVRQKRVITVTGKDARADLLVIPSQTNRALAVMILRQAAALPIPYQHQDSTACQAAAQIVHSARTECAQRAAAESGAATPVAPILLD